MNLKITAGCDVGCLRANNEDMVLIDRKILRDGRFQGTVELSDHQPIFLLAVADGMGGANAGEIASQMVLEGIRENIYKLPTDLDTKTLPATLHSICQEIHQTIVTAGRSDPTRTGMGTTLVALLWYERAFYSIHAGDSRMYHFRNETLTQITEDHSLQKLRNDSTIPSNIIYNAFGGDQTFFTTINSTEGKVLNGDVFLLCSDGVSDMLSDGEIKAILSKKDAGNALLDRCKEKGGKDNISYLLAEVLGVVQD